MPIFPNLSEMKQNGQVLNCIAFDAAQFYRSNSILGC